MSNDTDQDKRVSETYRSLAGEHAPPHLDRKVLEMAAAEKPRPLVVMADLNTTMWSPYYRRFVKQTALKNAARGRGILSTWPGAASPTTFEVLEIPRSGIETTSSDAADVEPSDAVTTASLRISVMTSPEFQQPRSGGTGVWPSIRTVMGSTEPRTTMPSSSVMRS